MPGLKIQISRRATIRDFCHDLRKSDGKVGKQAKGQSREAGQGCRSCNQVSANLYDGLDKCHMKD